MTPTALYSAGLVPAHEKAIYQRYRDGDKRQDVNRARGVKYQEPENVEKQQDYKNYPGHICQAPISLSPYPRIPGIIQLISKCLQLLGQIFACLQPPTSDH